MLKVKAADNGVSTTEALSQVWEVNPLSASRDFNASRAYRSGQTDGITVVRQMITYLPAPTTDNGTIGAVETEVGSKTLKFNVKLSDLVRFNSNGDTLPSGLKYYLVFQTDVGNNGATNSSITNASIKTANSGVLFRGYNRSYFVDN